MPIPRESLIRLESTPNDHCPSRCVRRAFLCDEDRLTGKSFEHRRGWVEDRIHELSRIVAIGLCAYAVMSNHFHVVLRIGAEAADAWSRREDVERWGRPYEVPPLVQRILSGEPTSKEEQSASQDIIDVWRERLCSISWFMRCVNEPIACMANAEDDCSGHFWEGRFKSQALLNEAALLQCMTYVDLNLIRAMIANTPEGSDYTSVQTLIHNKLRELIPFDDQTDDGVAGLPFDFGSDLTLVDWNGRVVRNDKRGFIPDDFPPILERLNIQPEQWARSVKYLGSRYYLAVEPIAKMADFWPHLDRLWLKGKRFAEECFAT